MRSSNPVLTRLGQAAAQERQGGQNHNQYGFQNQYGQNPFQQAPYGYPPAPPVSAGRVMNLDDVVVRTVALLVLTAVSAAASWVLLSTSAAAGLAVLGSCLAGVVLGLVISFARITNPIVISAYAVIEGVLLGVVSRWLNDRYDGIVVQAVAGTIAVFLIMAALYKFRVLRATARFTKFVVGALLAFVALSLINLIGYLFGVNVGLVDYSVSGKVGWLPILFAAAGIIIGALTFILDFAEVENGVRLGLPEKYAWYCAFGLLVGLIFLYWQILRLLSYLRR